MKVECAVLLLVSVLVCCTYGQSTTCPTIPKELPEKIKQKLNITKFLEVESWHEVKTMNGQYVVPKAGGCITVKYSENKTLNYLLAEYAFYDARTLKTNKLILQKMPKNNDYDDTFQLVNETGAVIADTMPYQILTTDYKNFAVIYGCNAKTFAQSVSILSKDVTLNVKYEALVEYILTWVNIPKLDDKGWVNVLQNEAECKGSASMFTLSTVLSSIVALLLVLRN